MDFVDALNMLADKVKAQYESIETEEATKTAFIMPFISQVLGYDVFDPTEVIPEFTADVGVKRGEKVDYAIATNGKIQILVECKKVAGDLTAEHASQLFRYFAVVDARIAILTNGRVYNFYTDLDAPNKMDDRPFLVLDLANIDEIVLPELKKLTKAAFDLDSIVSTAEELKYLGAIRRNVTNEFRAPSSELVRLLTAQVYDGRITQQVIDKFTPLVEKALKQFVNERLNDRLKNALSQSDAEDISSASVEGGDEAVANPDRHDGIETTEEELAAYRIIKAIACSELSPERITYRDAKSYFSVLADDNNRRPIVRCYFNAKSTKWIGFVDEDRNISRFDLEAVEDIYKYVDQIREAARKYA